MKKKKGKLGSIVGSIISVILILAALGSCFGGDSETETADNAPDAQVMEQEAPAEEQTEEAAPAEQEATTENEPEQPEEDAEEMEEETEEPIEAEPIEPIVYTGSGDDVVQLEAFEGPWILHITGNDAESHFSVTGYSADREYVGLLVNTTEKYEGITTDTTQETTTLEISAEGEWTVEQISLADAHTISAGETFEGNGDDVLLVNSSGSTANFEGNESENHFAVWAYGEADTDLLVNTTEKYSGTVMLRFQPVILVVTAVGDWTATF